MADLDPKERAKIASRAQAAAHKVLREKYPQDYRDAYQSAKDEMTERAERRLRET
jgi:hypothetical protein